MGVSGTALNKIYERLDTASSTYNAYDRHNVANMTLPAVSVAVVANAPNEADGAAGANELTDNHKVLISVRIHTDYIGGTIDQSQTENIFDDALEHLRTQVDLSDGYRTMNWEAEVFLAEFQESYTIGGEFIVEVHKIKRYSQT